MLSRLFCNLRRRLGAVVFLLVAVLIMDFAGLNCIIRTFTGVPCIGCGLTRCFRSLMRLDFSAAFYYYPLFPLVGVFLLAFLFAGTPMFGSQRRENIFCIITVVLVILQWVIRVLIIGQNEFAIHFDQSVVSQLVQMARLFFVGSLDR